MKGYFRFPMFNEKNIKVDSALIFGDIAPREDFICGISCYIRDSEVECRFIGDGNYASMDKNMMQCHVCGACFSPLGFFNRVYGGRKCPNPKCDHVFDYTDTMFESAMSILTKNINLSVEEGTLIWNKWEDKVLSRECDISRYMRIGLAYAKFKYIHMWVKSLEDNAVDKEGIKNVFELGRKLTIYRRKAWLRLSREVHQKEHSMCLWKVWDERLIDENIRSGD